MVPSELDMVFKKEGDSDVVTKKSNHVLSFVFRNKIERKMCSADFSHLKPLKYIMCHVAVYASAWKNKTIL